MKPCIESGCPNPATSGPRCEPHRLAEQRARSKRRGARHYDHPYRTHCAELRQAWTADPGTRCSLCARPLENREGFDRWTCDHVNPGDPASPLAPAHPHCNSAKGNRDRLPET